MEKGRRRGRRRAPEPGLRRVERGQAASIDQLPELRIASGENYASLNCGLLSSFGIGPSLVRRSAMYAPEIRSWKNTTPG